MKIFQSFTPEVVELIRNGAVGIIPTDTIYGIVSVLSNKASVSKIYELKNRPAEGKAGTTLIGDVSQIAAFVSPDVLEKAQKYWPGPVSIEMSVGPELSYADRGFGTLAFRIPDNQEILGLLHQTGPLSTSSVNYSGMPPATTVEDALAMFGERVDFYVDGGDLGEREPSGVIRFTEGGEVEVIRGIKK